MYFFKYLIISILFVLTFTSCSDDNARYISGDSGDDNKVVLKSIQITPSDVVVPVGTTGLYTAIAYYSDNTHKDISTEATWNSADTKIVDFTDTNNTNYAQALSVGSTTISANFNGVTSNIANVDVTSATLQTISLSPVLTTVASGIDVKYTATGHYSDNTTQN